MVTPGLRGAGTAQRNAGMKLLVTQTLLAAFSTRCGCDTP
jgi:hypothetical protein